MGVVQFTKANVTLTVSLSLLLYASTPRPVLAILGESSATVKHDQARLNSTHRSQSEAGYTIHTLETPGLVIREYTSPDGMVFGLSWRQHTGLLNLESLFGTYYGEYSQAVAQQARQSPRFQRIETDHLIVERGGRMGATWGRAWIVALLPPGIFKEQIQ